MGRSPTTTSCGRWRPTTGRSCGAVFDDLLAELGHRRLDLRALHGEPHEGNRLLTPLGIRWIDLESVCRGPLEWDLAFLDEGARGAFEDVDEDLLGLLSALNSARVATWCWVRAQFPEMRRHARHHLALLRAGRQRRTYL